MKNGVIAPIPLNPKIQTLIERGDQAGNIPISGNTPEEFEASFNRAFLMLKSNKVSLNSPAPEAEIEWSPQEIQALADFFEQCK
ncbi:hypothetical protein B0187_00925 [Haemophilus paracuniculus]|uniref:Uncharacterized protein n=1 Tax=Haemophilus paracuniculus TaxID=734 RepID=A0A1T0AWQ2_9PAST|nr:hypothetical protein [Haemophilus paracuniculus]OOS00888.1 hypothetical protein B0187_00925 [Haemophilus paracuniculus]